MRGDSCFKGREFESWHRILDGYFFTYLFVVKFEMTKINEKEAGLAHLKKSFRRSSDWNFRLSGNVENVFWPILVEVTLIRINITYGLPCQTSDSRPPAPTWGSPPSSGWPWAWLGSWPVSSSPSLDFRAAAGVQRAALSPSSVARRVFCFQPVLCEKKYSVATSVTRLGYFWKVLATNILAKLAQMCVDFLSYSEMVLFR